MKIQTLPILIPLPGLWPERGELTGLVRLDVAAVTTGMVVVAKQAEPWQVWSDDLESIP